MEPLIVNRVVEGVEVLYFDFLVLHYPRSVLILTLEYSSTAAVPALMQPTFASSPQEQRCL